MARNVRVAAISFPGAPGTGESAVRVQRNREAALERVEQALADRPDLIVLPEVFTVLGLPAPAWIEHAEPAPGPTTERFAEVARRHRCYLVLPLPERQGERVYNAVLLLDRRGEMVARYHKMFPTVGEIEAGITPGRESPTFETDFGRLAFAVCFDLNFREVAESVAAGEPELIVFPSMYRGGLQTRIWAHELSAYFVSAIAGPHSAIVNPLGRVLAISEVYQPVIARTLNLDYVVGHIDHNHARWPALKAKYGPDAELEVASPEAKFLLTSHREGVSARTMAREFDLELLPAYWARAREARRRALPSSQEAPVPEDN